MKTSSGNRVMMYYPTDKKDLKSYKDSNWAYDGDHTIKGLMKFGADILPQGPFKHLDSIKQNVRMNAPLSTIEKIDKVVPIIFTHGVGNTMSFFSTILKDIASQGHIVFSLEHNDRTALYHFNEQESKDMYFKQIDMRD
jgi:Platelet-activating factor acetylhydrolase, isoform II